MYWENPNWKRKKNFLQRKRKNKTNEHLVYNTGIVCRCGLPNEKFCMLDLHPRTRKMDSTRKKPSVLSLSICQIFSSQLSSTPLTFSMTTLPNVDLSRLSISTENHNEADIQLMTAEHQQSEKMKHHNVIKKPFCEKSESENIVLSSASAPHANMKTLSPNCQLPWSLSQGRELTQLPSTSQTNNIEKLVATGTIWSPNISNKNLRSIQSSLSTVSPALSTSKKIPSFNSKQGASMNHTVTRNPQKEADLIYQDPLSGASNAFLLRVGEISSLEAETVRQERSRRLKKRNKLDRDSSSY